MSDEYRLRPIGYLRSPLRELADAPMQGSEGAPDAWLEIEAAFAPAMQEIEVGDELVMLTVREIAGSRLKVGPIEAIDGTPVVDVKPVLSSSDA